MVTTNRIPTHPGDVIKEELEARGISQRLFSENTGIAYSTLNEMLNGKRPMTSNQALVIEAALGINAEMLINMQTRHDMAQAREGTAMTRHLEHIRRICASWLL